MLLIKLKPNTLWDEEENRFYEIPGITLKLEHSLLSLSKWESKWKKPWYSKAEKTGEQWMDYIYFMIVDPDPDTIPSFIVRGFSRDDMTRVKDYIMDPMTATTVRSRSTAGGSSETLTSELIYYYMFSLRISKECENWHLNRLLMLLQVFGAKDGKQKKMSNSELMKHHASLNEANRKRFHTKG